MREADLARNEGQQCCDRKDRAIRENRAGAMEIRCKQVEEDIIQEEAVVEQ